MKRQRETLCWLARFRVRYNQGPEKWRRWKVSTDAGRFGLEPETRFTLAGSKRVRMQQHKMVRARANNPTGKILERTTLVRDPRLVEVYMFPEYYYSIDSRRALLVEGLKAQDVTEAMEFLPAGPCGWLLKRWRVRAGWSLSRPPFFLGQASDKKHTVIIRTGGGHQKKRKEKKEKVSAFSRTLVGQLLSKKDACAG